MIMLDKLAYSSKIRHKNTGVKWVFALGTLLIVVGFRTNILALFVLLVTSILALKYSSISFRGYIKLMLGPLVFLMLGTLVIAVDVSMDGLIFTRESVMEALGLVIVSLSAVSCLYFLTLTTPTLDMAGLLAKIHCPWIVIELMVLIYRFIFVLLDMAVGITVAQNCRLGNRSMKSKIYSMGQMLARLLVISLHKSTLLFDAMESRCYDGKIQVVFLGDKPKTKDIFLTGAFIVLIIAIGVLEKIQLNSI